MNQSDWLRCKDTLNTSVNEKLLNLRNIVSYCNEQFKTIAITYNCKGLYLPERHEVVGTFRYPSEKWRALWKFQRKKYCIKDLKN